MTEIILGLIGAFLIICAFFDVEWFMSLTRSAHMGYPRGRMFTRILYGLIGLGFVINALASL